MTEFVATRQLQSASVGIARRRTEEKRADNAFRLRATTKSADSSAMREQKDQ
jgi:hypothetical protein